MIKFYYNTGPNPMKIALFLEEANLDYEAIPIDTRKGEQHKDDYLKINPNAKAPTIVDGDNIIFECYRKAEYFINLASNSLSIFCLLYTSPSPRDQRGSGMPACG